jgi:hypothetical protein
VPNELPVAVMVLPAVQARPEPPHAHLVRPVRLDPVALHRFGVERPGRDLADRHGRDPACSLRGSGAAFTQLAERCGERHV